MKRGKKLFLLLLALAVLLGTTAAVKALSPKEEASQEVYTTIFTVDSETVTDLHWKYSEDVYVTKKDDTWVYSEDPAFPLDSSYIDTMLSALSEITSAKTIENVEDWDQYTLEAPVCEINFTADGKDYTIKVGEETSLGNQRYLSIGDGNAYLVDASFLSAFQYGLYDILKMEEVPEMDNVLSLEHISSDSNYTIENKEGSGLAYSDEYIWFLNDQPLDTELTETLLRYVTDTTWQECVNYHAEDLSKYGLDNPAVTMVAHYTQEENSQEQTFSLEIGDACEDGYYARISGSNMVYTIPKTAAEALIFTTYADLKPEDVLLMDWDQVSSVDIVLDEETYTIRISSTTSTDEDGNEVQEVTYTLDGEEIDGDSILNALDALDSTGYASGSPGENPEEIRFIIHQNHQTFPEVELVFYRYNSTSCMVTLNGEPTVLVNREDVVSLVETVNDQVL